MPMSSIIRSALLAAFVLASGNAFAQTSAGTNAPLFSIFNANNIWNGQQVFNQPIILQEYTVATLPTCNAALAYGLAAVIDATTPTYNGALTGGSTVKVPVMCDGTAWKSH